MKKKTESERKSINKNEFSSRKSIDFKNRLHARKMFIISLKKVVHFDYFSFILSRNALSKTKLKCKLNYYRETNDDGQDKIKKLN